MDENETTTDEVEPAEATPVADEAVEAVEDELLIEEVSIDGMCGVY